MRTPNILLRLLAVTSVLCATSVGVATAASAASASPGAPTQATVEALANAVYSSPDPTSAFNHLSSDQQKILRIARTPSGQSTHTVSIVGVGSNKGKAFAASPNVEGCWNWDGEWDEFGAFHTPLTHSYETLQVCYHLSVVQSVSVINVHGDGNFGWHLASHSEGTKNWVIRGEGVSWQTWENSDPPPTSYWTICPLMWGDAGSSNIRNKCSL